MRFVVIKIIYSLKTTMNSRRFAYSRMGPILQKSCMGTDNGIYNSNKPLLTDGLVVVKAG